MKPTGNNQVNTRIYWNHIYTTPARSKEYWEKTYRFFKLMDFVKDGDKFVDLGCGVGLPSRMIKEKKKGCEIWGVDISDEIIKNNLKDDPDIKYHQGYIGYLDFLPKDYFNVVFAGEVIEHIDNPPDLFKESYQLLKEGGKLIITTPIENHINSPEHIWEFTKGDIMELYDNHGFKKVEFIDLPDMEHMLVFFAIGTK